MPSIEVDVGLQRKSHDVIYRTFVSQEPCPGCDKRTDSDLELTLCQVCKLGTPTGVQTEVHKSQICLHPAPALSLKSHFTATNCMRQDVPHMIMPTRARAALLSHVVTMVWPKQHHNWSSDQLLITLHTRHMDVRASYQSWHFLTTK